MNKAMGKELRRRSLVKSLLWRFIGVLWTWTGAYIILLLIPPSRSSASLIATLIVVYHHSTRMVMYYAYERIWASVSWGRGQPAHPMSKRDRAVWSIGSALAIALVLYLIIFVSPRLKAKRLESSVGRTMQSQGQILVPEEEKQQEEDGNSD